MSYVPAAKCRPLWFQLASEIGLLEEQGKPESDPEDGSDPPAKPEPEDSKEDKAKAARRRASERHGITPKMWDIQDEQLERLRKKPHEWDD